MGTAENLEVAGTLLDQAVRKDPNFASGYLFAVRTNREVRQNLETADRLADNGSPGGSPGEREWILAYRTGTTPNAYAQLRSRCGNKSNGSRPTTGRRSPCRASGIETTTATAEASANDYKRSHVENVTLFTIK